MVGLLDLRTRSQSKWRRGKSMWVMRGFVFRLFTPPPSLSQSWSSSLRAPFSFFFDLAPVSRNLFFIALLPSDRIKFGFLFLPRRSRIGRKITFNYFYFLTNFIDISLRTDPMLRSPFFHFEESLSTDNIRWMLLWTLVGIIIFCDKLEEISFGHITLYKFHLQYLQHFVTILSMLLI